MLFRVITITTLLVVIMCFSFSAFAMDIPVVDNNPQIVIDGKGSEYAWLDSNRVSFDASLNIASTASLEIFNYKNTVYGLISLTDVNESETDFIVRVDFHYQNKSGYVVCLIKSQSVSFGNNDFNVEGMTDINTADYCLEFSFSTKSSSFKQGDLVKIEISYGFTDEIESFENVQGFSQKRVYNYYVGSELPENVAQESSGKTKKPDNDTKNTTKSDSINVSQSNFDIDEFSDYGYTDTRETTVIISVMAAACLVVVIIFCANRRTDDTNKPHYTEDDKGCD